MQHMLIGGACLGIAAAMILMNKRGRVLTVMALVAGFAVYPVAERFLGGLFATLSGGALGVAIAAGAIAWIVYELKDKGTRAATPWIALATPVLLLLAGGPFVELLSAGDQLLGEANSAVTSIGGGGV